MRPSEDRALRRELLPNGAVWGRNAWDGVKRCEHCPHIAHKTTPCAACGCPRDREQKQNRGRR